MIGLALMVYPTLIMAQTSAVPWSAFNMGFGLSSGANTTVQSSAGELLVGAAEGGDIRAESGFLVVLQRQQSALGVDKQTDLPAAFALHQNYPNPFNPSTTLQFDLPMATDIHIVVYDLLGREVVRLVDRNLEAGYHSVIWNGKTAAGRDVPSGIYIALMRTSTFIKSIKTCPEFGEGWCC